MTYRTVLSAFAGLLLWSATHPLEAAVGRTAGQVAVTPTGQAIYSLPIFAPEGTHGMTPAVALTYHSGGGSGWLGEGWSISGLSAVARCRKTWAQDGVAQNVRLETSGRYCLDGNQLRLVSGTYGTDGAEYRTEIESFARVKSWGSAGGTGPAYFIAETKDGLIHEYGNTADSRIESLGLAQARTWAVNQIRDRDGNALLFSYAEDGTNGAYRLTDIRYTANATQGLAAAYRIEFVYETQPITEVAA